MQPPQQFQASYVEVYDFQGGYGGGPSTQQAQTSSGASTSDGPSYQQMQTVQLTSTQAVPPVTWDTMDPQTPNDAVQQVSPASSAGESPRSVMKALHMAAISLTPTKRSTLSPSDLIAGSKTTGADEDSNDNADRGGDDGDSQQPASSDA